MYGYSSASSWRNCIFVFRQRFVSAAAFMSFIMKIMFIVIAFFLLAPCNAQSGVNTTFYLDINCTSTCSNCTISNPIITAGGCVQERYDVNSSSITTACNSSHVIGTYAPAVTGIPLSHAACLHAGFSYSTSNCSGAPVPFAFAVDTCRTAPSSNTTLPGLFYARTVCPLQPTFASLTPKVVPFGSQTVRFLLGQLRILHNEFLFPQRLAVSGTNFAVSPSLNCTAAFGLLPSPPVTPFADCVYAPAPSFEILRRPPLPPHSLFPACLTPDCFTSHCLQLRLSAQSSPCRSRFQT